jgi:uncharacterized protein YggE
MMSKSNIYVVMSAVFLAIIIVGGIMVYVPKSKVADNINPQITNLKLGSTPNLVATENSSLISPYIPISIAESVPTRTMSLSGTGTVKAQPDQAIVVLGVHTEDELADRAISDNALLMSKVVDALKSAGIAESDMQTTGYSVGPIYNYDIQKTVGYQVTNTLQVTVHDLTKVGAVIDTASSAGINEVNSVTFSLSDTQMQVLKLQAYKLAVTDVQAKEKVLADGFGITVSGIQSINESYYYPVYNNVYSVTDAKALSPTPIISGSLTLSVTLNVVYIIS